MTSTPDADLVIEALYQVAANPAAWDQLVAVLDPEGLEDAPPGASAELRRTPEIARLQSLPGDGAAAGQAVAVGWVVVARGGRVLSTNAQGREALAGLGGRVGGSGALSFDPPANGEAARDALAAAREAHHPIIVRMDRPGLESPTFVYAAGAGALPGFASASAPPELAEPGAAALVFPPTDAASRLWASVRASFGLTAAEVRLAQQLRDGRAIAEAARELGLSINTVRNQLRGIFDKMGLQRQSELVAALADLSALTGAIGAGVAPAPLAEAPPVRLLTLNCGRRLAYRDYGDPGGKVLLSFHEGLGSSLLPPGTGPQATALGLRIVTVDRPGFGQSDPRADYSFEGVAADIVELCDKLGLETMQVGAVLSGSACALHTAARLGPRATSVFLCSGRAPKALGQTAEARSLLTRFRARMEANPWVIEAFYAILRIRLSHRMTRRFVQRSAAHSPGDQAYVAEHPELVDYFWVSAAEALRGDSRGPVDELKAFRDATPLPLENLAAPVIAWHGAEDVLAPLDDLLAYLGDHAREVRVFPDIGFLMCAKHWSQVLQRAVQPPPKPCGPKSGS